MHKQHLKIPFLVDFLKKKVISLFTIYRYVVLTTSGGIMDHEEARRKHLGGKILGFFC